MKNTLLAFAMVVALLGGNYYIVNNAVKQNKSAVLGTSSTDNRYTKAPIRTSGACGTTDTVIVATSTSRQYLALVNDSANVIYVSYGVSAIGSQGIRLNALGGTIEMDVNSLYTGAVHCIASSTSVMTITQSNNEQ